MDSITIPGNMFEWVLGLIGGFMWWLVRGYVRDVKELRETHMSRAEVMAVIANQETKFAAMIEATSTIIAANQTSTDHNFRELRARLDTLNETILKVALK